MPFPLVLLAPVLISWGTRALAVYGLSAIFSENSIDELKEIILNWIVEQVAARVGLHLDPSDPFSDSSVAGAVGDRIGVPIRSLRNQALIIEDLDNFAAAKVSERSGYTVRSIQNVEMLKEDLRAIGSALAAERIGLPLGMLDGDVGPDVIKERVLAWAKAEVLLRASEKAGPMMTELINSASIEDVAAQLNDRLAAIGSDQTVTALQIANKIAANMAAGACADFGRVVKVMDKRSRRRELQRAASAKFRAAHGNRQVYVPLGMAPNIG